MSAKLACAVGACLLLSVTFGVAASRGGLAPGASDAGSTIPIQVARKHSSSPSQSGSSGRSFGSSAGSRHWSASRAQIVAPFRTSISPRASFSTPFAGRPHARFARRLVPLAALSTIYIGSRYYYPYRYMPYDGPVCTGLTENGCALQWLEVPADNGGDTMWQCVEFCPQE